MKTVNVTHNDNEPDEILSFADGADINEVAQAAFNHGHKLAEGELSVALTVDIDKQVYDDGYRTGRKSLEPTINKMVEASSLEKAQADSRAQASYTFGFDHGFDAGWKAARGANTDVAGAIEALKVIATDTASKHAPTALRIAYDEKGRMTGLREMKPGEPDDELSASREKMMKAAQAGDPDAQAALRKSILGTPIRVDNLKERES